MLKYPPPLPHWQSILYPYTGVVWAAVGVVVILATVAYYLVNAKKLCLTLTESFLIMIQVRKIVFNVGLLYPLISVS